MTLDKDKKLLDTKHMKSARSRSKGFTLIELMVVITIIAILSAIALVGMRAAQGGARNASRYQRYNALRAALEQCYSINGIYPADTTAPCWTSTVASIIVKISGSQLAPATETITYTQTSSGACYTLTFNVEPNGTYPTPAGTCPQ